MTDNKLLILLLCITLSVAIVGGYYGYSVNGIEVDNEGNLLLGSVTFLMYLVSFQIDDMPYVITGLFNIVNIMALYLIVKGIRGVSS